MKIIVTGGAGFIGSHIVDQYLAAGHDVLVLDNFSAGKLDNIDGNAELERLDLCEFSRVDALLASYRPDLINHHAAQIDVRKSVADPVFDAQVNVLSSVNLLDAAARHGVRGIIFASSGGTVYGETPQPATETSAKAPSARMERPSTAWRATSSVSRQPGAFLESCYGTVMSTALARIQPARPVSSRFSLGLFFRAVGRPFLVTAPQCGTTSWLPMWFAPMSWRLSTF